MNQNLKRNIPLDYIFTFFMNFNLTHALWMIWLSLKGLSLVELGMLEGLFHLTSFTMEVPTGVIADLWGRKQSRLIGRILFFISLIILWTGNSIVIQSIGFILTALSYNLESGAGEALLYDSLKNINEEEKFKKVKGRSELILQSSMILAYLSGGYLATINYNIVFSVTLFSVFLSILSIAFMEEPIIERESKQIASSNFIKRTADSILNQTKESLQVIKKEPRIAFLIIYSESIFVFEATIYFYLQTWWKFNGYSEFYMGIVFSILSLVAGFSALAAPKLEKKIELNRLFYLIPVLLLISLWGTALTDYKALFFIVNGLFEGFLIVIVSDSINKMVPSGYRATVLSYQSMMFSLLMIIVFPIVGFIGDKFTLDTAFIIISLLASIIFMLYVFLGRKLKRG